MLICDVGKPIFDFSSLLLILSKKSGVGFSSSTLTSTVEVLGAGVVGVLGATESVDGVLAIIAPATTVVVGVVGVACLLYDKSYLLSLVIKFYKNKSYFKIYILWL